MLKILGAPRLIALGLTALAFCLAAASAAQAQAVERSGNVYHIRVCPGPAAPGTVRCHAHVVTDPAGKVITNVTPSGYGPADLQAAYNVVHTASVSGTGPLIAIVDAYGYPNAERDLGVYRKQYGLPACTSATPCFSKVNQNGTKTSYPQSNANWDLEQALDLEMVSAICPECRILLVEANSASVGASNRSRTGSSMPRTVRRREITWVTSSEWPPSAKK